MNNYLLDIISKVIVCFLDHYSMTKSDFFFVMSNLYQVFVAKSHYLGFFNTSYSYAGHFTLFQNGKKS